MKLVPYFFGAVDERGILTLGDDEAYAKYLFSLKGKEIALSVKQFEKNRTNAENRYYWGVVIKLISEEMGLIPDDAHIFLRWKFLKEGVEAKGKRYEVARSTTSLSTNEFEEYVEKCRDWASIELGIVVPLPNEVEI